MTEMYKDINQMSIGELLDDMDRLSKRIEKNGFEKGRAVGYAEGVPVGKFEMTFMYYRRGIITADEAASNLGITLIEFEETVSNLGINLTRSQKEAECSKQEQTVN